MPHTSCDVMKNYSRLATCHVGICRQSLLIGKEYVIIVSLYINVRFSGSSELSIGGVNCIVFVARTEPYEL